MKVKKPVRRIWIQLCMQIKNKTAFRKWIQASAISTEKNQTTFLHRFGMFAAGIHFSTLINMKTNCNESNSIDSHLSQNFIHALRSQMSPKCNGSCKQNSVYTFLIKKNKMEENRTEFERIQKCNRNEMENNIQSK